MTCPVPWLAWWVASLHTHSSGIIEKKISGTFSPWWPSSDSSADWAIFSIPWQETCPHYFHIGPNLSVATPLLRDLYNELCLLLVLGKNSLALREKRSAICRQPENNSVLRSGLILRTCHKPHEWDFSNYNYGFN